MKLNARELGTVLAALRYWQRAVEQGNAGHDDEFSPIASDNGLQEPLTAGEIDKLCERINVEGEVKYTVSEMTAIGETIAEVFALKRSREYKDRYIMGGGYLTKTALGVFKSFVGLADKIRDGKEIKA